MLRKKIEIVVPVYNEEIELETNILKLKKFLEKNFKNYCWRILIVDNASIDKTPEIGQKLAKTFKNISFLHLDQKGRGRALKTAWQKSDADILSYMDVDLSTNLESFPFLISAIEDGFDIAIGSRLLKDSRVIGRTLKREILSRGYNLLIKIIFKTSFSDAQCGFKAINKRVKEELLPKIEDNEWFFDSELLIIGEKSGYKIFEQPVIWTDNPGSTVRVLKTVIGDLRGLFRLWKTKPWRNKSKNLSH